MLTSVLRPAGRYLRSVWEYRYFWMSLVKADLQRRYRRSYLGLGWSMLSPIAMALVLCAVYQRIFQLDFWEYGPFVLTGLAFWGFMSAAFLQGCSAFLQAETYIRQEPAPLAIFPLRTVLSVGFHALIALGLSLGFAWLAGSLTRGAPLLSLVPTLLLAFVLAWSAATVIAFASVYFPDVSHLTEVGIQILFFLTPVIYPPKTLLGRGVDWVLRYNPMARLLEMVRAPILEGQVPTLRQYAIMGCFTLVVAALAAGLLARLERRLIYQL
jgi:lipopolysaccharide transport system permease protein